MTMTLTLIITKDPTFLFLKYLSVYKPSAMILDIFQFILITEENICTQLQKWQFWKYFK